MNAKTIYTDRADAIDACETKARESGRAHVLMAFSVDGGSTWRNAVVSRSVFEDAPVPTTITTPQGVYPAAYDGYMFGREGRI